jgi:hypothetical protein
MEEIEKNVIDVAERNGFTLTEPIDFTHEKKVVHWRATTNERDYTFIFFASINLYRLSITTLVFKHCNKSR